MIPLPSWANPIALSGALLLGLVAGAAGGWQARSTLEKANERDRLAKVITTMQEDISRGREISEALQSSIAALRPKFTTIRQEVQREIVEKPVYLDRNCALPDSGRLRLDAAIDAANAAGRLDRTLSRPAETGGQPAR